MELYINIKKKLPGFQLDIALSSENGRDIIGILGASGSGKSMLLRCISGLVKPDQGQIVVNGRTFFDSSKQINLSPRDRKVGFLFQNYALFPHLSIRDNIAFALEGVSKEGKDRKVAELLEKFHLKDMAKKYPNQISGGQQQRVALARALAAEPEIFLLDEPFSALDDHLRNHMISEMLESLKEYQGTVLYVTHNMEEAYRLCERIAVLNTGSIEAFALKRELFQNPVSLETAKITGCKNLSPAIKKSDYTIAIPDWGIQLKVEKRIVHDDGYAGIRANHIKLINVNSDKCREYSKDIGTMDNCFPVWIADESETPFHTTLYLKIGSAPQNPHDFHLQWEISQEKRLEIQGLRQPFDISLPSAKILFVYQ